MGKLIDSPLEGSSGRVGRFVVANVGGVEIIRRRPRAKAKIPTNKQLLVRERFKNATELMAAYNSYSSLYFGNPIKNKSRHSQASSNAMASFVLDFDTGTWSIDNQKLMFAKGKLLPPVPLTLTTNAPGEIQITWTDNSEGDTQRETDSLSVLVAINQTVKAYLFKNVAQRSAATVTLQLPLRFHNNEIAVWLAFANPNIPMASNSEYVGTINV